MASVQELIAAAQAQQQKHPLSMLADLINAGSSGYTKGVNIRNVNSETDLRRAEIVQKLVATQQAQQAMEAQRALRKQLKEKLAVTAEQNLRAAQGNVGAPKTPTTPASKFTQEWTQDAKGNISRSIKEVSPVLPKTPSSIEEGLMARVNAGELTLEQAIRMKGTPQLDRSMQAAITKAKVELAENRPLVEAVTKDIERIKKLNETSYGGAVGALKMKYKSLTDADVKNNPEFVNTAEIINTLQALVTRVLKSTFGGQLSDSERSYLDKVYGAAPNLSRAERAIAMDRIQKMMTDKMTAAQSKYNELSLDAGIEPAGDGGGETPAQRKARLIQELQGAPK